MFSNTLVFSAIAASLYATSAYAAALDVKNPSGLVQCDNSTISWTGGVGPYNVYIYTGCESDKDDPIYTVEGVTDKNIDWYCTLLSGAGVLVEVEDSKGDSAFADEVYIGGEASQKDECSAKVKKLAAAAKAEAAAESSSSVAATSTIADGSGSGDGVANAAAYTPTFSGSIASQETEPAAYSGASALIVRPASIVLGAVAVGFAAFF